MKPTVRLLHPSPTRESVSEGFCDPCLRFLKLVVILLLPATHTFDDKLHPSDRLTESARDVVFGFLQFGLREYCRSLAELHESAKVHERGVIADP